MKKINFIDATKDGLELSMKLDKKVHIFGLGVGNTSNIYGSTSGLKEKYGNSRVFDTPSSESALTAMAAGMSLDGLRPVLIHQRFDFMIYSLDQIVNWISLWSYKSGGKSQMPLTIRAIVGKGWGQGPQHSKSLHSWFSHLPGISVVYPSSPSEAKGCFMTSIFSNFPTIIFESRSLHATEEEVPEGNYFVDITKSFIRKKGKDITLVGFGPSINDILDISKKLENEHNIKAEVLDLRTLNPLDEKTILQSVNNTKRLAVVEYGWPRCSISSEIISIVTKKINLKSKPLAFNWPNGHVPTPEKLEHQFYFRKKSAIDEIVKLFK